MFRPRAAGRTTLLTLAARPIASTVIAELSPLWATVLLVRAGCVGRPLTDKSVLSHFKFNSGIRKPLDSGAWGDVGTSRRRNGDGNERSNN